MSRAAILARERRWGRPAGLAAIAAVALLAASLAVERGGNLAAGDGDAESLLAFHRHAGTLLVAAVLRGASLALLVAPLLYLFFAARDRSERVKPALIGLAVVGPLLLAIHAPVNWAAFDGTAGDFAAAGVEHGKRAERLAESLIEGSATRDTAGGLLIGGALGLAIALVYIPLQAMRAGLLTRFWGTLGMALGASLMLLPVGLIGVLMWFLFLGLLFAGWWPPGRPPAWAAGEAIPWPPPGERPPEPEEEEPPAPTPTAPAAAETAAPVPPATETAAPHPRSKKRKRRRR